MFSERIDRACAEQVKCGNFSVLGKSTNTGWGRRGKGVCLDKEWFWDSVCVTSGEGGSVSFSCSVRVGEPSLGRQMKGKSAAVALIK